MTSSLLPRAALAVCGAVLLAPQTASAARPAATTGPALNVIQQSARLTGFVNANGLPTTYAFQYGRTRAYGAGTTPLPVSGTARRGVSVDVASLTPGATYHYRLIATNSDGVRLGGDRTFTTPRQPLGVTFAASPNPAPFFGTTTISGQVTGTANAGVDVALQVRPFPYTAAFAQVGNRLVTDREGRFTFPAVPVWINSQARIVLPQRPNVASGVQQLGASARVTTSVGTYRVRKGSRMTFSGKLYPAVAGTPMAVMRKNSKGGWSVASGFVSRTGTSSYAKYSTRVRIRSSGTYRAYVGITNGQYQPAFGREIRIRVR